MKNPDYDLAEFTRLLVLRNNDPQAFNCEQKESTFYIAAMVEELGEMAGALKKLERGFNHREKTKFITKLKRAWEEKHPGQPEGYFDLSLDELETLWIKDKLKNYMSEAVDLFSYIVLLNTRIQKQQGIQIDFFTAVKNKFNEVSKELNPNTTYILNGN